MNGVFSPYFLLLELTKLAYKRLSLKVQSNIEFFWSYTKHKKCLKISMGIEFFSVAKYIIMWIISFIDSLE